MTTTEADEFENEIIGASIAGREDDEEERPRYIDWDELADDKAAVLLSVVEIGPEEETAYGTVAPVICRVIVLSGEDAGAVYQDVKVFKGGIRRKVEAVGPGKHVVGRLGFYTKGEGRNAKEYVGLNDEKSRDRELARKALVKFGKVEIPGSSRNGAAKKSGKASTKSKAAAAVEDDDDQPPF